MQELLQTYSISEILIFLVLIALATKGCITFFDWAKERLNKESNKEVKKITEKKQLEKQLQEYNDTIDELHLNQIDLYESVRLLTGKVDLLINSDKDDIKSFLTKEHHYYCYQQGWIDDYSLECCEKRFAHYQEEGGNSFIEGFMEELRQLPKQPPQT